MKDIEKDIKLIFLYDKLMRKEVMREMFIRGSPLSLGMTKGALWRQHEGTGKTERITLTPGSARSQWIYGVVYRLDYWMFDKEKVAAYYNNLEMITGCATSKSTYRFDEIEVVPFKVNTLEDIKYCNWEKTGSPIKCLAPVHNEDNDMPKYIRYRKADIDSLRTIIGG